MTISTRDRLPEPSGAPDLAAHCAPGIPAMAITGAAAVAASRLAADKHTALQVVASAALGGCLQFGVVVRFGLDGRDVSDRLEEATVVEPVDPFKGGKLHGLEGSPRPSAVNDLGLEEADPRSQGLRGSQK